jgi:hypothetical protein
MLLKIKKENMNLLEKVQQNLGYPALQKIDVSTDKIIDDSKTPNEDKFSQAAIPAVLTALYKYVQTDEGATEVLNGNEDTKWIAKMFDEHKKDAIEMISSYSKESSENPLDKLHTIAKEAIKITKETIGENGTLMDVKSFFKQQKKDILLYLLPTLKMGELLNDGTLDDNTNKMEGPISSLMHTLGNVFASPTTEPEAEKKQADF